MAEMIDRVAAITDREYQFCHYKKFDYNLLKYIRYARKPGTGEKASYNDVIIMVDTETSKKLPDEPVIVKGKTTYKTHDNHICSWTISIRAYHHNIVTLWGRKPSNLVETMMRIHASMSGHKTIFYVHNLGYDYWFLRQFLFDQMMLPSYQLNVKSHYPIIIEFITGVILKDSLILAQRKLEKWANDLNVEHKKAVGSWDYSKLRNQNTPLTDEELNYMENDTLAGVECIDATCEALNKKVYFLPLTATGIPREQVRKRGKRRAHTAFKSMVPSLYQYRKLEKVFHGGMTHGNRHYYNQLIDWNVIEAGDFASSYPYTMLAYKFPMEAFKPYRNCKVETILESMEEYAFMFKFVAINIKLKDDFQPMPALQFSKAVKTVNAILDNGRVLAANYVEIYLSEYDLAIINEQYTWQNHVCTEVEYSAKDYLPKWFTDYVFECFTNKTKLKGGDPVQYSLAKATVNSLYGMCVQHSIQDDIVENYVTGEYEVKPPDNEIEQYQTYIDKVTNVLPYQWGVWVTAIAFYNLHMMVKCCRLPLYCDTDSCYGIGWDWNKVAAYNQGCKDKLIAAGYGPVLHNNREYWLGLIEHDEAADVYTQYKYMGAKRYCGRGSADGELHLTVAGVPKKTGVKCLKDDLNNFAPGFIFSGSETGKMTHVYFHVDNIYIDENGNETGDSISLIPCDYELDSCYAVNWEELFNEEVEIQVYDEN